MTRNTSASQYLTWLHLSDLHMCRNKSGYDSGHILETLTKDIKRMNEKWALDPDFFFFTGDLVFGEFPSAESLTDQYADAEQFLQRVRASFSPEIPRASTYLVPGNHDVQRSEVTEDQVSWLNEGNPEKIVAMMHSANRQWTRYMERLNAYRDFLRRHYPHLLQDPKRLIYAIKTNVRGIEVGIAGFNSAWSCSRDKEKGALWLGGKWQLGTLRNMMGSVDVGFALIHHPLSWLHEGENDYALAKQIEREFSFHLHGHEHDDWVTSNRDSVHARVAAAACYYHTDKKNGYNIVKLDLSSKSLSIWLRKYDSQGGGWVPNLISGKTDDDGCWRIDAFDLHSTGQTTRTPTRNASPVSATTGESPSTASFSVNHAYDVFLAAPMASLPRAEYKKRQREIARIAHIIRIHCGLPTVFCPAEEISSPDKFDPPDLSIRRGLSAIRKARYFVMVYSASKVSSTLVEAGFALALQIPSLYFVQKGQTLPFLLQAASQEFRDVKTYPYSNIPEIVRYLKEYGGQIFRDLEKHGEDEK